MVNVIPIHRQSGAVSTGAEKADDVIERSYTELSQVLRGETPRVEEDVDELHEDFDDDVSEFDTDTGLDDDDEIDEE